MTKPKGEEPSQLDKFKALARESECELGPDAFDQIIEGTKGIKPATKEEAFEAKRKGEAD